MMRLKQFHKESMYCVICLVAIFIGLSWTLSGCSLMASPQAPAFADRSFTSGQPCAPPCWYGLELDKSAEKDVYNTLQELPFVDAATIKMSYPVAIFGYTDMTEINYRCVDPKGELCGNIFLLDGVVKAIDLKVQYDLSLQSVIAQLGPPEYMRCFRAMQHDELYLNWPDQNISTEIYEQSLLCGALDSGVRLDPDLNIGTVSYMSKDIFTKAGCNTGGCIAWPGLKEK